MNCEIDKSFLCTRDKLRPFLSPNRTEVTTLLHAKIWKLERRNTQASTCFAWEKPRGTRAECAVAREAPRTRVECVPLKSPRGTVTQQRGAASHGHRRHILMTVLPGGRRRRWIRIRGAAVTPPERGLLGGAIPCPKREAAHGRWWPSIFIQLTEFATSLPSSFVSTPSR